MKRTISIITILSAILFTSCMKINEPYLENFKMTTAISVFVNDGKVGVTTLKNENNYISTEYWIDSTKSTAAELQKLLPKGASYRTSIDNYYLATTVFRKMDSSLVEYKFLRQYSLEPASQLFYFKDGERISMDTMALGAIQYVYAGKDDVVAGFYARRDYFESGVVFVPAIPFYRDGKNKPVELPMPSSTPFYFQGTSCIHKSGDNVYVGGIMNFPMYWKNTEVVKLSDKYGLVNQIQTQGNDVYAVGYYNKNNSRGTGHTACYWLNGKLIELEDNAIAYSIFLVGKDVYVAGAVGKYDAEYKACYWKNGKRYMLPN